jgi:hypothetical protein
MALLALPMPNLINESWQTREFEQNEAEWDRRGRPSVKTRSIFAAEFRKWSALLVLLLVVVVEWCKRESVVGRAQQ